MIKEDEPQKITINDFRHWLEGVIDMQGDDWVPNAQQWSKILSKIYDIDDKPQQPTQNFNQPIYRAPVPQSRGQAMVEQPIVPNSVPQPPLPMSAPSSLISAPGIPSGGNVLMATSQLPTKTPNIDGNYSTPFA